MRIVNRTVVVLRPKQPFIDWVLRPPNPVEIPAEDVREHAHAYLVPACWKEGDKERFVRRHFRAMFDAELEAWALDEAFWPAKRDYRTFCEWFDPLVLEIPYDLCNEPLQAKEEGDE